MVGRDKAKPFPACGICMSAGNANALRLRSGHAYSGLHVLDRELAHYREGRLWITRESIFSAYP